MPRCYYIKWGVFENGEDGDGGGDGLAGKSVFEIGEEDGGGRGVGSEFLKLEEVLGGESRGGERKQIQLYKYRNTV